MGGNLALCPELIPWRCLQTAHILKQETGRGLHWHLPELYNSFPEWQRKKKSWGVKIKFISIIQHHRIASLSFFIINEVRRQSEVSIQEAPRVNVNHLCLSSLGLTPSTAGYSVCEHLACNPGAGWQWAQAEAQGQVWCGKMTAHWHIFLGRLQLRTTDRCARP